MRSKILEAYCPKCNTKIFSASFSEPGSHYCCECSGELVITEKQVAVTEINEYTAIRKHNNYINSLAR